MRALLAVVQACKKHAKYRQKTLPLNLLKGYSNLLTYICAYDCLLSCLTSLLNKLAQLCSRWLALAEGKNPETLSTDVNTSIITCIKI